ncbi:MAG: tRNA (adenosine(37)-N6)-threonylcarbamoyltransferase complex transferase subunit TsaD [Proteobacteria bacterium]|nr:tRNA (adenosine(37)-N6)-threonylcarbamoyltransferase complex transferase subunit TsaD [Pseudomonadota bacterium]
MLLALESSCDETSASVVHEGRVLANVVSSQIKLHAEYGGVVPELATREHLRNLLPVTRAALQAANVLPPQLDAIAATIGPGLPQALMIGARAAQAMAFALRKPFFGIHHHEAHLYSPWITGQPPVADFANFQPNVSLIVSGGHTMLVFVESELKHHVLGSTVDDAAGECFDKTAKLMGLPYPGGPELDALAEQGDASAFDFPRPMIRDLHDDFSFSGLKTSVRYFLRDQPFILDDPDRVRDLCASVRGSIVDVLVTKTVRAAKRLGVKCVTASGGVTCNRGLRKQLTAACANAGLKLRLAEKSLCTDNAAMVGILAERKLLYGHPATSLDEEVKPNWPLAR